MSLSRLKHSSTGSSIPVARPEVCQHSAQLYLLSSCCNCCFIFGCALCPHPQCQVGVVFRQVSSNSDQFPPPLTTVIAVSVVPCAHRGIAPMFVPVFDTTYLFTFLSPCLEFAHVLRLWTRTRKVKHEAGECGYISVDRCQYLSSRMPCCCVQSNTSCLECEELD